MCDDFLQRSYMLTSHFKKHGFADFSAASQFECKHIYAV